MIPSSEQSGLSGKELSRKTPSQAAPGFCRTFAVTRNLNSLQKE